MTARPDILLANSFLLCEDPAEQRIMKPYPPLGLLHLSSFLKRRGFGVEVFDGTFTTPAAFESALDELKPLTVGISCNMGTKLSAIRMIGQARQCGIVTVLGGPEPGNYPQEFLDCGADCIVIGEGEITLDQFLRHIRAAGGTCPDEVGSPRALNNLGHIPGIAFLDESRKAVRTHARPPIETLSELPWPDRGAIDLPRYLSAWRDRHGYGPVSLICARGCPYRCTWCSHSVFGRTHRRRDVVEVADEVEHIRSSYNPDALWFADDVFNIDHKWLYEFRDEMIRRQLTLPFECICRADRMNERVVSALSDLRCERVWIGAESGSQKILDAMKRGIKIEQVRRAARLSKLAGLEVGTFIMLGYDGEELEDIEATIDHLKEMAPDIVLTTIAYPIKGTEYYDSVSGRLTADASWLKRTDRDLRVRGKYPHEFYELAKRWVNSEVEFLGFRSAHGQYRRAHLDAPSLVQARAYLRARWYRYHTQRYARRIESADQGQHTPAPSCPRAVIDPSRERKRSVQIPRACAWGSDQNRHSTIANRQSSASPFDSIAPDYDERFTETALGRWLRQRVWERWTENIHPGGNVLELAGGTGEDACWLARHGVRVTCTDGSPRMLEMAARKVTVRGLSDRVTIELLDLNQLPWVSARAQARGSLDRESFLGPPRAQLTGPFDAVLANFGGINGVADRRALASWLAQRTEPGAYVALTVMGPICPWEIAAFALTKPALCLRRWRCGTGFQPVSPPVGDRCREVDGKGGEPAFQPVYYPSPAQLTAEFEPWFTRVRLTGLGIFLPPTQWQSMVQGRPRLLAVLGRLERAVAGHWPATWLNDHYILELLRRR